MNLKIFTIQRNNSFKILGGQDKALCMEKIIVNSINSYIYDFIISCSIFPQMKILSSSETESEHYEIHISLTQIRDTGLKHSQNLHNTTSNHHKHKKGNKSFAYRCIVSVFCRLANGDLPTFIDVAIEFLLSIANVSWCWLYSIREKCWISCSCGVSRVGVKKRQREIM